MVPHWASILVFSPGESCSVARWQGEALDGPELVQSQHEGLPFDDQQLHWVALTASPQFSDLRSEPLAHMASHTYAACKTMRTGQALYAQTSGSLAAFFQLR